MGKAKPTAFWLWIRAPAAGGHQQTAPVVGGPRRQARMAAGESGSDLGLDVLGG